MSVGVRANERANLATHAQLVGPHPNPPPAGEGTGAKANTSAFMRRDQVVP